jgi:aryl-alcohol dehydrogenase-like predicted oxidoreductase
VSDKTLIGIHSAEDDHIPVISTAKDLGVAVLGYSPVARGILSMQVTKAEDLEDGDIRKQMTRFKGDVGALYPPRLVDLKLMQQPTGTHASR